MKKLFLLSLILASASCEKKVKLDNDQAKAGYAIGQQIGNNLKAQNIEVDPKALAMSITDVLSGKPSQLSQDEINQALMKLQENMGKKAQQEAEKNLEAAKKFLEQNKTQSGFTVTASGLQIKIESEGTGEKPTAEDTVKVHYRGTLSTGEQFDSSYDRGQPAEFPLKNVIPGWTEGLQMMKVGSKAKLVVPPELGYGASQRPGIPANSVLVFDVELVEIVKPNKQNAESAKSDKTNKKK
jgi:FKBP-type peptidyl-prolyl cis-trans isomerase FkpA/FKBP-type peptidyl-prolyl cis-trans isomerase FklB